MNKLSFFFRILIFVFCVITPKVTEAGMVSYAAAMQFLKIPVGARSSGMGEAFTAIADDASAIWWNPAGMAFLPQSELSVMCSKWLPQYNWDDLRLCNFSAMHNFENIGTAGLNVTYNYFGKIQRTSAIGTDLGTFRAYELAVTCAFGTKITDNFAFGVAGKYIYSNNSPLDCEECFGNDKVSGWAVDYSMMYKYNLDRIFKYPEARFFRLQAGTNLVNIGPMIKEYKYYCTGDKPLPANLRSGLALIYQYEDYFKASLSYEIEKELVTLYSDGSFDPVYQAIFTSWHDDGDFLSPEERREFIRHAGIELWFMNAAALRFGHYNDIRGSFKGNTRGFSLQYMSLKFDYSYLSADKNQPSNQTERYQLSIFFHHIKKFDLTPWN